MGTHVRWKLPLSIGGACVLLALVFAVWRGDPPPEETPAREVTAAPASAPPTRPSPPAAPPLVAPPSGGDPLDKFLLAHPPEDATGEPRAEYPVKLEELQARFPDNLYWKLDAPTNDPQVLQQRAEEWRRWNELFGKVQAGDASEEEIHRYYEHRRQRSEDYIAIASLMLTEGGEKLPESDQGLLSLSIQMHRDRLKEVPRQIEEALARKQLQDKRREEWLRSRKSP